MAKKPGRIKRVNLNLRNRDLGNKGVTRLLLKENATLKDSLKQNQNELERLREEHHALDKENGILNHRLNIAVLPELVKFLISSVGTGFAVSFFFSNNKIIGVLTLVLSVVGYWLVLWSYKSNK